MSRLGPALRSQFMKGVKDVLKTTAKETMKSAAEEMLTARPRLSSVGSVSIPSSLASPISLSSSPSPQQQQFPALCVCKYEPNAPDFENGQKQYICSSCSKTGLRDYKTVIEGRTFAGLKGGVGVQKTRKRSRLHLTKRMRRRHNGRSRR
jgi:hypothetical protein